MDEPLYCPRKLHSAQPQLYTVSASVKDMPKAKNDQNEKDMEIGSFKIGSQAI